MINMNKLVLSFLIILLLCSPMSVENESTYSIRLNLEYPGNVSAEFTGEPVLALIETTDSVPFSSLTWRTGNGLYRTDDSMYNKKNRKFYAYLFWNTYPKIKDTASKSYYDTIYIGIGGNLKRSNSVIIKVSNLPVIIDSLRASTRTFKSTENPWVFNVDDSISKLHIRVFARDLDNKTPDMDISGSNNVLEKYLTEPFHVSYTCPAGQFRDTLIFIVHDRNQGQDVRELLLARIYPNVPPVIDSISINTLMYRFSGGSTNVVFEEIDTLNFHLFCHDVYDSIRSIRWSLKKNKLKIDSTNKTNSTMICTTSACKSIATRIKVVVDTLRIVAYDSRGDSTIGYVYIGKGILNKAPVLKKVIIDDLIINDTNTSITIVNSAGFGKKLITLEVSDPDSNDVFCSWKVKNGKINANTGKTVTYTAPGLLLRDTVAITVTDNELSTKGFVIINVNDIFPVIDSLSINMKTYISPVNSAGYHAFFGEQIVITTWIRDLDKTDSARYSWQTSDPASIKSQADNRIILQAHASKMVDTIILSITDGTLSDDFRIFINVNQPEPVIDSVRVDSVVYKNLQSDLLKSITHPDTLSFKIHAHDPQGDSISFGCESLIKNRILKSASAAYSYVSLDSTYIDTLTISVKDMKSNSTSKKVILNVKGGKN